MKRLETFVKKLKANKKISLAKYGKLLTSNKISNEIKEKIRLVQIIQYGGTCVAGLIYDFKTYDLSNKIGSGSFGISYKIDDNKTLKVFSNKSVIDNEKQLCHLDQLIKLESPEKDFISSCTSFADINPYFYKSGDKYGYFTKTCNGDLFRKYFINNQKPMEFEIIKSHVYKMCENNIVHGDIKFANILYKDTNIYIHDFDGYILNTGGLIHMINNPGNIILYPTYTALYASPIYIIFSNVLYSCYKKNDTGYMEYKKKIFKTNLDSIDNSTLIQYLKSAYKISTTLVEQFLLPSQKNCYNGKIRQKLNELIRDIYVLIKIDLTNPKLYDIFDIIDYIDIEKAFKYSDIYSLAASYIHMSFCLEKDEENKVFESKGTELLKKYLELIKEKVQNTDQPPNKRKRGNEWNGVNEGNEVNRKNGVVNEGNGLNGGNEGNTNNGYSPCVVNEPNKKWLIDNFIITEDEALTPEQIEHIYDEYCYAQKPLLNLF